MRIQRVLVMVFQKNPLLCYLWHMNIVTSDPLGRFLVIFRQSFLLAKISGPVLAEKKATERETEMIFYYIIRLFYKPRFTQKDIYSEKLPKERKKHSS